SLATNSTMIRCSPGATSGIVCSRPSVIEISVSSKITCRCPSSGTMWVVVAGTSFASWSFTRRSTFEPWTTWPTFGATMESLAVLLGRAPVDAVAPVAPVPPPSSEPPQAANARAIVIAIAIIRCFGTRTPFALGSSWERLLERGHQLGAVLGMRRDVERPGPRCEVDVRGKMPGPEAQHLGFERLRVRRTDRERDAAERELLAIRVERGHVHLVRPAGLAGVDVGLDLHAALERDGVQGRLAGHARDVDVLVGRFRCDLERDLDGTARPLHQHRNRPRPLLCERGARGLPRVVVPRLELEGRGSVGRPRTMNPNRAPS